MNKQLYGTNKYLTLEAEAIEKEIRWGYVYVQIGVKIKYIKVEKVEEVEEEVEERFNKIINKINNFINN